MNTRQIAVEAVKAADEFFARRLWRRIENEQIVGIDLPDRPPIAVGIMGAAGQEFGLHMLIGERAVEELLAIGRGDLPYDRAESPSLSFTLTRRVDIAPPFDRPLVEARRQGRTAPLFLCLERGLVPRALRKDEYETLVFVTRALLIADAAGRLEPGDPDASRRLLTLQVTGTVRKPEVAVALQNLGRRPVLVTPEEGERDGTTPDELADLPVLEARYCVGMPLLPMAIEGESGLTRAVLVLDATNDLIAAIRTLESGSVAEAREHVFAALHGSKSVPPGLPRTMVIADRELHAEIAPGLQELGVECSFDPNVPELAQVVEALTEHLHSQAGAAAEVGDVPEPSGPDDLDGWKAIDFAVTDKLVAAGGRAAMGSEKAWRKYLGVGPEERAPLMELFGESLLVGYLDWYALYYRATKSSRTIAERVLAEDLSPAMRAALLARQAAKPSFCRIDDIEVGEGVELYDILGDTSCFVSDRSLSTSGQEGWVIPARIHRVGSFSFAISLGPVVSGVAIADALDHLESDHGLQLDAGIEPARCHLLGRLWPWRAAGRQGGITLQNHDGHELRWHTVRFSVADPRGLASALEERADIDTIEAGVEWSWRRDTLALGHLELLGGEQLVLEVNSAERQRQAREWLEAIAGVRFESLEEKDVDPRRGGRQLDDELPQLGPIDPDEAPAAEMIEVVQRMIDERCMGWLDESIPMLGGKSPRQTCKTAAGRRKVAQLIRTYPDPGGIPGIKVPRARMLAELGLGDGGVESEG